MDPRGCETAGSSTQIAVIATFESLDTLLLAGTPLEADKHFPGNVQDMCPWLVRINDIVATAYSEATNPLERHFELFTYDVESNHPCFLSNRTITQLMGKYQDFKAQRDEMATRMEHRFQALECEVALEAPGENLAPVERYLAILEAKASKEAVVTARQYEFDSDVTPRAGLDALRTRFVLALTDALAFLAADDERFTIRLQRRLALCLRLAYAATCSGPPRAIIIGPASLVSRMENLRTALMEAHDLAAHNVLEDVLKTPSDVLRTSDSVGTPEEETKSLD
ncbi:MAG: uncharacterized protein KVP18_000726 [Porospora cf. gigantea A]|uniref:uncharacterized protein n=1 Tax=Porospora cf. gigantea A TaxID=2853593 RepID=UPI003559D20C|nr:MAG: hypothetical protein KVP18_000726 [Porospora cf. gigantea A]